jgi:hypothetical protein
MTTSSAAQLNDHDLEQLSAYLDRQLSEEERRTLEERLENEPELRRALDELRATVGVLHDLEPVRPPRSFTIAPESVAPRRSWLGWLTAVPVAAVLMIALLFSQMQGAPSAALAPVAQQAAAPTAAPASESSAAREAPPPAPEAAAPITMDAAATAAPAAEPTAAPAATSMPEATLMPEAPTPPAAFQAPGDPSTASEAGDTAVAPVEPAAIAAAPTATAQAATANEAPGEAAGGAMEPTALATPESALATMAGQAPVPNPYEPSTRAVSERSAAPLGRPPLSLLVGVPIGLAAVVLVLVVLARRRRQ